MIFVASTVSTSSNASMVNFKSTIPETLNAMRFYLMQHDSVAKALRSPLGELFLHADEL